MKLFDPYTPVIHNPYPVKWTTVSGFEYLSHLYLARALDAAYTGRDREAQYIVAAEYRCRCHVDGAPLEIVVPSGMLTDLTSVPWLARGLVGRVGPHLEAAIVHDFLFAAWQDIDDYAPRERDFRFANEVMLQAMIAADVNPVKRTAIFLAVSTWIARRSFDREDPLPRYVRVPSPEATHETAAR